jgi:hypothetical protein
MPDTVTQRLDIIDATSRKIRVSLTDAGDVIAGGEGSDGDLVLRSSDNQTRVRIRANGQTQIGGGGAQGELAILSSAENNSGSPQGTIHLKAYMGQIIAGGPGGSSLTLKAGPEGKTRVGLDAVGATIRAGGNGHAGMLHLYRVSGEHGTPSDAIIDLDGQFGRITAGCQGTAGELLLRDSETKQRMRLNGATADLKLYNESLQPRVHLSGTGGDLRLGGSGAEGDLVLFSPSGEHSSGTGATMRLSAAGAAYFGGNGSDADLTLFAKAGDNRTADQAAIRLNASDGEVKVKGSLRYIDGTLRLGSGGQNGIFLLRNSGGAETVRMDGGTGDLTLGGGGQNGTLIMRNSNGVETVRVDGSAGDIILDNADCAEDFDLADGEEWVAGAVMSFNEDGLLCLSTHEYDTAVAGVVSGAGHYRPGIVLDRRAGGGPRVPLAMLGKVFCLVDADFGAVRPGSLLTTSPRRGHAMRAADPSRAFGAVIGKALRPLERGQALIPVMVSLQ